MNILLIDDSATMRKITGLALKAKGHTFTEAENGQDALDKLPGIKPDLFLVDINMPVMGGIDFVRALRVIPEYKSTPVIFLTTEAEANLKEESADLNVSQWLKKPYQNDALFAALECVQA